MSHVNRARPNGAEMLTFLLWTRTAAGWEKKKNILYICSVWTRHSSAHLRFNLQCKRHISGGQQPMCVWYQGKRVGDEIRGTKIKAQWINSRIGSNKLFYMQSYQKRLRGCLISVLLKDISTHIIMLPTSPPEPQPSPRMSWAEHQQKAESASYSTTELL